MGWETFKRGTRPAPGEPAISIAPPGRIGLNVAVVKNIILPNKFKFALLMYDRERRLIGIKFTKQSNPDAYPLMVSARGSSSTLAGTAFVKTFGIPYDKTTKYRAKYDDKTQTLIADLSQTLEARKVTGSEGEGAKKS